MNLLLFTEHPELHSTKRLLEESMKQNIASKIQNPYEMAIESPCKSNFSDTIILHRTTGIRHNDYDLDLSSSLKANGAKVYNSPESFFKLRDKQKQAIFYNTNNLNAVPTYSFRNKPMLIDIEKVVSFFETCDFKLNSKESFILKALRGNQGFGVSLINGKKSLFSILETFWAIKDQEFIIQPFIEDAKEYRVLVINGEIFGAVEKWPSKNEFRANSFRGEAKYLPNKVFSKEISAFSKELFKLSEATYAGIDLIVSNNRPYLLEINLVPGFKLFESLSNKNIAKVIIDSLIENFKENL